MMNRYMAVALCLGLLSACGDSGAGAAPSDAERMADVLSGDAAGAATDNPVCRLFRPEELEPFVGEPLEAAGNAAMGSGCQWLARDGSGDVLIQIVPSDYHPNPYLAEGYRELPDLGTGGHVAPFLDGWLAATIHGESSISASVAGQKASAATAEALLREVLKRRG